MAATVTDAPAAFVAIVEAGHLSVQATFGMEVAAGQDALVRILTEQAARGEGPLLMDNLNNPQLDLLDATAAFAFLGVPLRLRGASLGALCVMDRRLREWGAEQVTLLEDVAAMVVAEIELNAWRSVQADDRRGPERRYRQLFEEVRTAIYMTTRDGRFIDANSAMLDLFGYTREELLNLNASELYVDPRDRAVFQREIDRLGYVREHEVRMKRKDGSVVVCLKTAGVDRGPDGTILGYQGILHDITDRKQAETRLAHSAFHDPLTGLPNRTLFMDRLERLLSQSNRRRNSRFALLFLDLDRFKIINDSLGHLVGDQLLISVARRLENCIREEDTVARLGGDEFAIILDNVMDANHPTRVAERILQELSVPFSIAGRELQSGASIGIALSMTGYDTIQQMIRDADTAMYRAKGLGRNRYEVFDTTMHNRAVRLLKLETELTVAVERESFVLQYLPIFEASTRKAVGVEALLRWQHPERGMLLPGEFMGVAEDSALIIPLGWWSIRSACEQMKLLDEASDPNRELWMSVNVSGRQLLQPDLITNVDAILRSTGLRPDRLRLEIPENDIMRNADAALSILLELNRRGIQISIDDFGTGFSSLSYLQCFPISSLKIDRSFTTRIASQSASTAPFVRTIVALARSMDVPTIAEGVESEEQLRKLIELGVDYVQGFLLSPPVLDPARFFLND